MKTPECPSHRAKRSRCDCRLDDALRAFETVFLRELMMSTLCSTLPLSVSEMRPPLAKVPDYLENYRKC